MEHGILKSIISRIDEILEELNKYKGISFINEWTLENTKTLLKLFKTDIISVSTKIERKQ